jgi:hypothetical protein
MLIDHDFDWEVDEEESPRPGVEELAAVVPGLITNSPRPEGGTLRPSDGVVIIETSRGLSRGTLAVAVVTLVLSATLKLSDTRHQARAGTGSRLSIDAVSTVTNDSVGEAARRGRSSDGSGRRGRHDVIQPVGRPDRAIEAQVVD